MEEIIKGFNEEKKVIVLELANIKDYHYKAGQDKAIILNARLKIIDEKIDKIQVALLSPNQA